MITLIISCSITRIQVKGENKETKIKIENALKADSTNIKTSNNFIGITYIISGDELASKEEFNTREEAEQYIERKPWELIFNLNVYTIQILKNIEDEKKGE